MASVKIVVTGPFGAGKTSLIRSVSEIAVVSTERDISDHTKFMKKETTVAMDFGRITIDPSLVLYLFGTPGQTRFDFMWEVLSEGMLGFVLLLDASRPESYDEARSLLETFKSYGDVPYVVAVNRFEGADQPIEAKRARDVMGIGEDTQVLPVNALDRQSVKVVLLALLDAVLNRIDDASVLERA